MRTQELMGLQLESVNQRVAGSSPAGGANFLPAVLEPPSILFKTVRLSACGISEAHASH